MKTISSSKNINLPVQTGASVIETLVGRSKLFLFSYSIELKTLISWSDNAEEILGVKDISISRDGNLFLRHVHPDDRYVLLTELEKGLTGQSEYRATYRWIRPDNNETHWLHCRAGVVKYPDGELFEGIIIDLSSEFTGETSRLAGPDSIQSLISAFPTLAFTVDRDLRLLRINRAPGSQSFNFGDENFNLESLRIGRPLFESFEDQELAREYRSIAEQILGAKIPHHRKRIALDETVYNLEITPLVEKDIIHGLLFIVSDISDLVRLETEMAILQKAEGLSLLAAGVAHNFNNALQGILGHASILANHSDNKEFVEKAGNAIIDLVKRSSELAHQLLAYNQESSDEKATLDLNTLVMTAINAVDDLFTSGIKVAVTFGSPDKIRGTRKLLGEAISALLRNAKEAISHSEAKNKALSLRTSQIRLGNLEISDLPDGVYAKLSITDTGTGMEGETLKRCFEPFFTTKERDPATGVGIKPSGLGLPRAFSIIREMGGTVKVESAKDLGTTVAVYLPIIESDGQEKNNVTPLRKRNPKILIIDDDQMVLTTVQNMISDLGYECIVAEDSYKALSLLKQFSRHIKLILLDAIMPGVDSATVLRSLKKINPNINVIAFSGATPKQTEPLINAGALQILRKPVSQEELREIIQTFVGPSPIKAKKSG